MSGFKFTKPVSMAVTIEEYNRDLKQPLMNLGYTRNRSLIKYDRMYLTTTYSESNNLLGRTDYPKGFTIKEYNPELFLALAAMTDSKYGIKGEYYIATDTLSSVTKGEFYVRQQNGFIDKDGRKFISTLLVKATKKQLVEHFTLPTDWYIKVTSANEDLFNEWQQLQEDFDVCFRLDGHLDGDRRVAGLSKHYYDSSYYQDLESFFEIKEEYYPNHVEITNEQFKQIINNKKQNNMTKIANRFPFTLEADDAKQILECACTGWKSTLSEKWGAGLFLNGSVEVTESEYIGMRFACNIMQNIIFDDIFGEDDKYKNPFKDDIDTDEVDTFFKSILKGGVIKLATYTPATINRPDLAKKSFYVADTYKVVLHETKIKGTIIELVKR